MNRYATALGKGKKEYDRVVQQDMALLKHIGASLLSVESSGGVRVTLDKELRPSSGRTKIHPWQVVELDPRVWEWLRPHLEELQQRRDNVFSPIQNTSELLSGDEDEDESEDEDYDEDEPEDED